MNLKDLNDTKSLDGERVYYHLSVKEFSRFCQRILFGSALSRTLITDSLDIDRSMLDLSF